MKDTQNLFDFLQESGAFVEYLIAQHRSQLTMLACGREQFQYWADSSRKIQNETSALLFLHTFERYASEQAHDFGLYFPDFHYFDFRDGHRLPFEVGAIPLGGKNMVYVPLASKGQLRCCDTLSMNQLFGFYAADMIRILELLRRDYFSKEEFKIVPKPIVHFADIVSLPVVCASVTNTTPTMQSRFVERNCL